MEPAGWVARIFDATANIDAGRKGFAVMGKEREGRISYETGIAEALLAFEQVRASADPGMIIRAEQAFISQELHFCDKADRDAHGSLTLAMQGFTDALSCLGLVDDAAGYKKFVDNAIPHIPKYRVDGFPKDAFHIACRAHKMRIRNVLRAPGIDAIEKNLLKQRRANLSVAEKRYMKKQEKALSVPE